MNRRSRCRNLHKSKHVNTGDLVTTGVTLTFDRSPLDLLSNVLFLLGLQGQFNEDLLKLLVDVVDAELRSQATNLVILAQAISL
jgi:hypothetical protein